MDFFVIILIVTALFLVLSAGVVTFGIRKKSGMGESGKEKMHVKEKASKSKKDRKINRGGRNAVKSSRQPEKVGNMNQHRVIPKTADQTDNYLMNQMPEDSVYRHSEKQKTDTGAEKRRIGRDAKKQHSSNTKSTRKERREESQKQQEENKMPVAQVRKRRVPASAKNSNEKKESAFIFPDFSINESDPFASDHSINSQLDALLSDSYEGSVKSVNTEGVKEIESVNRFNMSEESEKVEDDNGVPEEIAVLGETDVSEEAKIALVSGGQCDDSVENGGDNMLSAPAKMMNAESVFVPEQIQQNEFNSLHFRKRENVSYSVERIPEKYSLKYDGKIAQLVVYSETVKQPHAGNAGTTVLYNSRVYAGDNPKPWDGIAEVRVRRGETVSVDFGVGVLLPEGYVLQLVDSPLLFQKFGLKIAGNTIIGREEASHSIIVDFVGCTDVSYIAKNQSLISCKVTHVA